MRLPVLTLARSLAAATLTVLIALPAAHGQVPLSREEALRLALVLGEEVHRAIEHDRASGARRADRGATPLLRKRILVRQGFACESESARVCTAAIAATDRAAVEDEFARGLGGERVESIERALARVPAVRSGTARRPSIAECLQSLQATPLIVEVSGLERADSRLLVRWELTEPNALLGCESGGAGMETELIRRGAGWSVVKTRTLVFY